MMIMIMMMMMIMIIIIIIILYFYYSDTIAITPITEATSEHKQNKKQQTIPHRQDTNSRRYLTDKIQTAIIIL